MHMIKSYQSMLGTNLRNIWHLNGILKKGNHDYKKNNENKCSTFEVSLK